MSETVTEEIVKKAEIVAIVGYATCTPIFIYICYVLARILITRSGLKIPAIICSLLIIYNILMVTLTTISWTEMKHHFEQKTDIDIDKTTQNNAALTNFSQLAFNLAYWLFAFNYYALSWRLQLIAQNESPDLHNSSLYVLNVTVILIMVLFAVLGWAFWKFTILFCIFTTLGTLTLFISVFVLLSGIRRMNKSVSPQQQTLDKRKLVEHLISYIFMISVSIMDCAASSFLYLLDGYSQIIMIQDITIAVLAINMLSEFILILIMNDITTKVVETFAQSILSEDSRSTSLRISFVSSAQRISGVRDSTNSINSELLTGTQAEDKFSVVGQNDSTLRFTDSSIELGTLEDGIFKTLFVSTKKITTVD